jgi:peptide/nickel transport system permease protein
MPERSPESPALLEAPMPEDLFAEAPVEVFVDAVTAPGTIQVAITRRRGLGIAFWLSVSWIGVIIFLAILAGVLPVHSPNATGLGVPRAAPSSKFWLGTDDLGRDMLARIIYGARVSMIVGFASIAVGLAIGGTLGVIAGYYKGRIGKVIMGCVDVLLAFPALVLALAIVTFLGQSLRNVVIAIGVLSIAPIARIIRASTISFAEREFVTAARALGARNRRIIIREILPNVVPPTMAFSLVYVAVAIVAEGGLAFLGLSVKAPTASWGGMINEGRNFLQQAPYISLIPAFVMFITVLAFNFAGDSLRAKFDPRAGAL